MIEYTMTRKESVEWLASAITNELSVTTVSAIAREWEVLLPEDKKDMHLCHAWMGACTSIAFGMALTLPHRKVISMDGDGSILMDLPVLPAIAHKNPSNLIVIIWDNASYIQSAIENGRPNWSFTSDVADLVAIAKGSGIRNAKAVWTLSEFQAAYKEALETDGPHFIVAKVPPGRLEYLEPPEYSHGQTSKFRLVRHIEKTENVTIL
jgi:sulfopyruvate decarboxylase subunit beta